MRAGKARHLLRYLVETEQAGRAEDLREVQIASALYGREPSYDPKLDGIVRVNAARLRVRLEEHYAGHPSAVRIVLPVGSYEQAASAGKRSDLLTAAAIFPGQTIAAVPSTPASIRPSGWRTRSLLVAASVSPDGRAVAFIRWQSYAVDDVYTVGVDDGTVRRITSDNRDVQGLQWKPGATPSSLPRGRQTAFYG